MIETFDFTSTPGVTQRASRVTKQRPTAMLRPLMTTMPSALRLALGQSLAIDLHHCERALISDRDTVKAVLERSAAESGATIVDSHFHQFSPQGISGVVVITESHFAIHTWPEYQFAAVDVFTCGSSVDLQKATRLIKEGFRARAAAVTHHLERGTVKPPTPADQLTVLISVHGCRDHSEPAARRFLDEVTRLAQVPAEPRFVRGGFSLLGENLSVSGRINAQRVDVSVMSQATVPPPALAAAALAAFDAESFTFHTGL